MGRGIKDPNFVLTIVVFCCVVAAGFVYLHVKKSPFPNINIDVAIVVSLVCGLSALFFLIRSLRKRPGQEQEVVRGYHMGPEEPFGC